jgi:hypothetical protein
MSRCNITLLAPSTEIDLQQDVIDSLLPRRGLRCHFVKTTTYPVDFLTTYSGYSAQEFHRILLSYQESGILQMFYKFQRFVTLFQRRLRVASKMGREEEAEVPFRITDPKIISIFIGWGILIISASLVFLAESFMNCLTKLYLVKSAISYFGQ